MSDLGIPEIDLSAPRSATGAPKRVSRSEWQVMPGGRPAAARPASRTPSGGRVMPGGRAAARAAQKPQLSSVRLGDLDRPSRREGGRPRSSPAARPRGAGSIVAKILAVVAALAVVAVVAFFALARSGAFTVERIDVQGVEHLTAAEMEVLVSVPQGTSLLEVDTEAIRSLLLQDAWIQDVTINRVFPDTLQIVVTERTIEAVVEVPTGTDGSVRLWAIASDGVWLMPIPDQDSEAGQATSAQIYEDVEAALRIVDVPYGTSPEIGETNSDENIANALAVVSGLTTELADRVTIVSATDPESTTLTLDNGIEIAFGTATDIRAKERVCLELMEQHPGSLVYINVRNVDRPTYRAL